MVTVNPFRLTPNLSTRANPSNMGDIVRASVSTTDCEKDKTEDAMEQTLACTWSEMRCSLFWPNTSWIANWSDCEMNRRDDDTLNFARLLKKRQKRLPL